MSDIVYKSPIMTDTTSIIRVKRMKVEDNADPCPSVYRLIIPYRGEKRRGRK